MAYGDESAMNLTRRAGGIPVPSGASGPHLNIEVAIHPRSENRTSAKFVLSCYEGPGGLPILPAALFVFEPLFVRLSVRHGGAFEGLGRN